MSPDAPLLLQRSWTGWFWVSGPASDRPSTPRATVPSWVSWCSAAGPRSRQNGRSSTTSTCCCANRTSECCNKRRRVGFKTRSQIWILAALLSDFLFVAHSSEPTGPLKTADRCIVPCSKRSSHFLQLLLSAGLLRKLEKIELLCKQTGGEGQTPVIWINKRLCKSSRIQTWKFKF